MEAAKLPDLNDTRALKAVRKELQLKTQEVDVLQKDKDRLEQELETVKLEIPSGEPDFSVSQSRWDIHRLQLAKKTKEVMVKDGKIAKIERQRDSEAQAARTEGNEIRSQLITLTNQNTRLEQELQKAKLQIAKTKTNGHQCQVDPQSEELVEKIDSLSGAYKRLEGELEFSKQESKVAKIRAGRSSEQEEKLRTDNSDLQKRLDAVEQEKEHLNDECEARIKEVTSRHRSNSITSSTTTEGSSAPTTPFKDKRPGMSSLPRPTASRSPIPIAVIQRKNE